MTRVHVIEHEPGCPLDRFGPWLDGVDVKVVRPYAGDEVPDAVAGGLIVLGGQMCAYDDEDAPWLPAVRALLARSAETAVPTLGICLGAQLLAAATGGRVDVNAAPGRESGVIDVHLRAEAGTDALFSALPDPFPGPSMHADAVVELPPDAVWLASSAMYPYQAFRAGAAAWGIQFHPEVSAPTFEVWAGQTPDLDDAAVVAEFASREREVAAAGEQLARAFAKVVVEADGEM